MKNFFGVFDGAEYEYKKHAGKITDQPNGRNARGQMGEDHFFPVSGFFLLNFFPL